MAKNISIKKKHLLVSIHVIAFVSWFGATLCLLLLGFYLKNAENSAQLVYTLKSMQIIDENLLKYPALATLISGILLSIWTQWGLVKYYWVVIKLVLTIVIILLGIFFINDWFSLLVKTAQEFGNNALKNDEFQSTWFSIIVTAIFNIISMTFMTLITYYKPFGKIKKKVKSNE